MFILCTLIISITIFCCKSEKPEQTNHIDTDQVIRSDKKKINPTDLFEQARAMQARAEFAAAEEKYRQATILEPQNAQYHPFERRRVRQYSRFRPAPVRHQNNPTKYLAA